MCPYLAARWQELRPLVVSWLTSHPLLNKACECSLINVIQQNNTLNILANNQYNLFFIIVRKNFPNNFLIVTS